MGRAQATSISGNFFVCSTQSTPLAMSRYTRDYGKSSSWYTKERAPTKNAYSGCSKRATRGYKSHEWDEDASRGSIQTRGAQPETWADAEVEIMGESDRKPG